MKTAKKKTAEKGLVIKPVNMKTAKVFIKSTSSMIQHAWSEKGLTMLRATAQERRKMDKTRDPEQEGVDAAYRTEDGRYGIPAMAVKKAMIECAHKDTGIPRTTVRKALRFKHSGVIPIESSDPVIREDIVRIGINQTDLRYRPEFATWSACVEFSFDADLLTIEDVLNLIDRAGFSVGIGEWRPEKDGEHGTFQVDRSMPLDVENAN